MCVGREGTRSGSRKSCTVLKGGPTPQPLFKIYFCRHVSMRRPDLRLGHVLTWPPLPTSPRGASGQACGQAALLTWPQLYTCPCGVGGLACGQAAPLTWLPFVTAALLCTNSNADRSAQTSRHTDTQTHTEFSSWGCLSWHSRCTSGNLERLRE